MYECTESSSHGVLYVSHGVLYVSHGRISPVTFTPIQKNLGPKYCLKLDPSQSRFLLNFCFILYIRPVDHLSLPQRSCKIRINPERISDSDPDRS